MTSLTLFDIVQARLDAMAYRRVVDAIKNAERNARFQRLGNLCAEHAYAAGFTVSDFVNQGRKFPLSKARQDFMAAAQDAGFTLTEIGTYLGGRDHTTILHGIRQARARRIA